MVNETFKKRGRPKNDNSKSVAINCRMNQDDLDRILAISNETGESISEVIRNSVRIRYNLTRYSDGELL